MNSADAKFQKLLENILNEGSEINTRNSVTLRMRTQLISFDKTPLISIRRTAWRNALREFEWFLSGSNNIHDLHPAVRHWWNPWVGEDGTIPNNYSIQFCNFVGHSGSVNQIEALLDGIKHHPFSRRNVITTWNTADMLHKSTPITNCHNTVTQVFVEPDGSLHITTYQRSSDMVLGVPHNWIQMWAFLLYLCHQGGRTPGTLTWVGGDCHIYESHYDTARKMIETDTSSLVVPNLVYKPTSDKFKADDFSLDGEYKPIERDKLEMIV